MSFAPQVLGVKQIWISQPTGPITRESFAATRLEAKGLSLLRGERPKKWTSRVGELGDCDGGLDEARRPRVVCVLVTRVLPNPLPGPT